MADWLQGKSAKMWINEICAKQFRKPRWDTREAHPGQQPPTFICKCTITYSDKVLEAQGTGKTKQGAEQEAALVMLKHNLQMTPDKLISLNSSAKRKPGSSNIANSPNSATSSSSANSGIGAEGEVSDTDDKESVESEMVSGLNPISELMSICDQKDFETLVYEEVNIEGPAHKRIFTVSCTVPELGITFLGRRNTKKLAKRLAAFRVLREVKKHGFKYVSHVGGDSTENKNGASSSNLRDHVNGENSIPKKLLSNFSCNEVTSQLASFSLGNNSGNGLNSNLVDKLLTRERSYCDDKSEKCLVQCKNYSHAFNHLNESETLNKVLTSSDAEYTEFGGPLSVLQRIAREIGIKLCVSETSLNIQDGQEILTFLRMDFPFNFKYKLSKKFAVFGRGNNSNSSRYDATKNAIKMIICFFTSENAVGPKL